MEFQQEELNEILNIFQQESSEIIASMDSKLLLLERGNNPDLAIQLFRDAHSLKGSARMLGFNHIQNIAHKIEDIISLIKENKIKITSDITEVISECLGFIMMLINNTVSQKEEAGEPSGKPDMKKAPPATRIARSASGKRRTWAALTRSSRHSIMMVFFSGTAASFFGSEICRMPFSNFAFTSSSVRASPT